MKEKSSAHLFHLILENSIPYTTKSSQKSQIPFFKTKTNFPKNSFFSRIIMEKNNLDVEWSNLASSNAFKKLILNLIRPKPNKVFNLTLVKD